MSTDNVKTDKVSTDKVSASNQANGNGGARRGGASGAAGKAAPGARPARRVVPGHTIVPNTIDPHQVLIAPIVSEKSLDLSKTGKFAFRVAMTANKIEIRRAIEKVFPKVHVTAVNTLIVRGKLQRRTTKGRRVQGYKPNYKKAIVTLAPGETLPIFENL